MKWRNAIAPQLRNPAALAATLVITAIFLAWFGLKTRQEAQVQRQAAASRYSRAETSLLNLERNQDDLRHLASLFQRWQARGRIGPAKPREWSTQIPHLKTEIGLTALHHEFQPSTRLGKTDHFSFQATPLKLHLELLHEEDLLRFIPALEQTASALVEVRSCRLSRLLSPATRRESPLSNLSADCEIDWVTADQERESQSR